MTTERQKLLALADQWETRTQDARILCRGNKQYAYLEAAIAYDRARQELLAALPAEDTADYDATQGDENA